MPPLLRFPSSLPPLLFIALLSAWTCHCQSDGDTLDQSLLPSDPSPSPAPFVDTANPLRDPQVRKALIRALARSLQRLGDEEAERPEDTLEADRPQPTDNFVRFRSSLVSNKPVPNDDFISTTPREHETEHQPQDNFLPDSILNEVDKHIQNAEFHRVPPNEVHVTSKVAPRPFSVDTLGKTFRDSLSSSTEGVGEEGNSLATDETTDKPRLEDIRIEQHELKPLEPTASDASLQSKTGDDQSNPSSGNTVDIFRAPLIAAFTVHQDYLTGATRGVVPLLPESALSPSAVSSSSQPQGNAPSLPLQNRELQDLVRQITTHPSSSQTGRFPFLSREQVYQRELLERQRAAQQQAFQRGPQQPLEPPLIQQSLSPDQQVLEQRLRRIRQLQELQHLQERLLRLQQQVQVGL